jgi:preprotein translocase subunit SecG
MSTLETILMMLLVADAIALTVLVLLQQGKGADVGAAFGSGSASTMFGSAGSTSFFTKLTVYLAIGFFLISFGLAYTAKQRAAAIGTLGIPLLETTEDAGSPDESANGAPAGAPQAADTAPASTGETGAENEDTTDPQEKLTPESDSVDSDIPDL